MHHRRLDTSSFELIYFYQFCPIQYPSKACALSRIAKGEQNPTCFEKHISDFNFESDSKKPKESFLYGLSFCVTVKEINKV